MDNIVFLIFRRMRAPLLALLVTYAVTMAGLVVIPGEDAAGNPVHLGFFEALYFISYTATTIGYGEIPHAFTGAQRIWVTFCIYATVIVWLYSIGSLIALLQDKTLQRAMQERRFGSRVRNIPDPFYLICGYGQTGSGLVRALTDRGQRAVVLDSNAERVSLLKLESLREYVPALCADVRHPDSLLLAGLRRPNCRGVLALTSDNDVNLRIALAAKLLHPGATVICRADSHPVEANMASFGTDHIYDPFDTFALYFATALQAPCLTLLSDWLGELRGSALQEAAHPPPYGLWVICGYGRFGKALYNHLKQQDIELVVIEAHPERTGKPDCTLVHGPGTEADTLEQAEIHRAVGVIAGTDNDANNLSIVMTAKALNPGLFTVLRENQLMNRELFDAVDADIIMHPSLIVAHRIRMLLGTPLLTEFVHDARFESDAWACELIDRIAALVHDRVPDVWQVRIDAEDAYALMRLRHDEPLPKIEDLLRDPRDRGCKLPAIVLMRSREDGRTLLPDSSDRLRKGDELLFCGRSGARSSMLWTLQNVHALTYVLHGASPPRGIVWEWLLRLRRRRREARDGSATSSEQPSREAPVDGDDGA
ncbi:potassium transporter TrkA [Thiohalocapsa halophila]|uniref:Potassium transporter TrkA n=1 Tax=Thiohalocapsa halophila TaxID=69359 RepID=A0ABS1CPX1_9GAMM|nr:potassium channel protein [Thiohalocapsa halophila]MBK1633401.1 potassium transporter TrkA [Thiohalocapsa halophila]